MFSVCTACYAALLLPSDHPREGCLAALRQPGLDLLSREFTAPPREAAKTVEKRDIGKRFGWAYKELKGKQKPTRIKIPKLTEQTSSSEGAGVHVRKAMLKRVTVAPKVDCWLTFKEYQKFARWVLRPWLCGIQNFFYMHGVLSFTGMLLQGLVSTTNTMVYLKTMHSGQVLLSKNLDSGFPVKH